MISYVCHVAAREPRCIFCDDLQRVRDVDVQYFPLLPLIVRGDGVFDDVPSPQQVEHGKIDGLATQKILFPTNCVNNPKKLIVSSSEMIAANVLK